MRPSAFLIIALLMALPAVEPVVVRETAEMPSVSLASAARFSREIVPECSALWASSGQPGLFWTLSDSGAKPRISALQADGTFVSSPTGPGVRSSSRGRRMSTGKPSPVTRRAR
ncbi:hypothetical protein EMGBD4_11020 [Verrucomicrobiota bacterium]|nr:hypothetical protein EMGBD4_11020 [Verrucomicrobiota bacterium]